MPDQKPDDRTISLPEAGFSPTTQGTIGRFIIEGALGAGGMGVVVAARDPALDRRVAIKVLRSITPASGAPADLLAREAQAMARVQHPNVIHVYEVGTVGNQLFVVMELVDGQTLKGWMREKPRSERELISMFVAAGRGLEAVHAAGLVHRDFKPDNVLLGHEGRPRVSDFGLVRAPVAAAPPTEGEVSFTAPAGTPAYMAPEQFAGVGSDARSDQFSFCVTLYEAICAERPFAANAVPAERHAPASAPRGWWPSARLFEIVARGLANRPEDRWPSMTALLAALEEDRVARRRRIVAGAAVALVSIAIFVAWIGARRSAAQRVRAAESLGQQVQQIQSRMRAAFLLPLHDTKPERDRVRAQMKSIESKMRQLGDEGRGPGELALGIGHFELHEQAEARKHLEAAWAAGERTPDLAYDLGLVLCETYRSARINEPPGETKEQREARLREIQRTLRDPAFAYLRQAEGAADTSPKYVAAMLARMDRRFDEALRDADAALAEVPSLYEAAIVGGEIQGERAVAALNGNDKARGLALVADCEARFQRALEIGRSDPRPYQDYSDWLMSFSFAEERLGIDSAPLLEHAMELGRQGQQANSEATWPDMVIANSGWLLADSALIHHRDPRPYLQAATTAATRAVEHNPHSAIAYSNLGGAWLSQADDWDLVHGADAGASFQKAIDAFKASVKIADDIDAYNNLGLATAGLAAWRTAHGDDAGALVDSAVAAFDQARSLRPDLHFADAGACDTLAAYARDRFDRGLDVGALLDRADRYCGSARAGDPGMPEAYDESARIEGLRAEAIARAGADPTAMWDRAARDEEAAIKINPKNAVFQSIMAELAARRAEHDMEHGGKGRAELARAQAAAAEAVRLEPTWPDGHRAATFVELVRARAASAHGDPTPAIAAGLAASERVLGIKSDDVLTLRRAAELRWIEARHDAGRGLPSSAAVAKGRELVRRSLAINPRSAPALAIAAGLDRIAAGASDPPRP